MSEIASSVDKNNDIEVVALKPVTFAGNVKCYVSFRLAGVTIHNARILQQPGKQPWVAMPQTQYVTKAGEKKYAPVVELSEPLRREVSRVVLAQWEREASHAF